MLTQDKPKVVKESVKKAKAMAAKKMAEALYPRLLIIAYSNAGRDIKTALDAGNMEMAAAIRRGVSTQTAEYAIECAVEFAKVWKKKRGQFFCD